MIPLNVLHCLAGYDMEGMHETLRKKIITMIMMNIVVGSFVSSRMLA